MKVGIEPGFGYRLSYGNTSKLARIESLSESPAYRIDLFYDNEGRVSIEKNYEKYFDNWRENIVFFYTYTNGKLTGIREMFQWATPAIEQEHQLIWEGDNIRTIIIRSGGATICTNQFTYDMTRKNPMAALIDLYYSDNLGPSYKLPLYRSDNMLIKEETNCPSVQTTNITYEFNDKNLLQEIVANGYKLLSYSYECH